MKKFAFLLSLILLCLSCQNQSQSQKPASDSETTTQSAPVLVNEVVSVERFKALMTETSDFQLIDVRTPEEYSEGHIEASLNLNFRDANFDAQLEQLDKTKPVLVYCRSGNRSGQTAAKMKALQFQQVFDLEGGFEAWAMEEK